MKSTQNLKKLHETKVEEVETPGKLSKSPIVEEQTRLIRVMKTDRSTKEFLKSQNY